MRKAFGLIGVFELLTAAFPCRAQPPKEPAYVSDRPLYACIALSEDGAKVMKMVFDESQGPGKGYDVLYADMNLNDDLTDEKPFRGDLRREGSRVGCTFPLIEVRYSQKGAENPCKIVLSYRRFNLSIARLEERKDYRPTMTIQATMTWDEGGVRWEYRVGRWFHPAEKGEPTPVIAPLGAEPVAVLVFTRPDDKIEGNLGIAAFLVRGMNSFRCSKDGNSPQACVLIKDKRGKVVRSEEVPLSRLSVGSDRVHAYSVPIPEGDYEVSVTTDAGPLAGLATGSTEATLPEETYRGGRPPRSPREFLDWAKSNPALVAAVVVVFLLVLVGVFRKIGGTK